MLKPFPDSDKYVFKEKFIEKYSKLTDWNVFKKYTLSFLRKSIRINTLKISVKDCVKRLEKDWILEPVPWCDEGFYIEHKGGRRDVGNTIEHALGYYYVQEAASMIPPLALQPKSGDIILDMAAAPGSKTSQMASMMENGGVIIANDIKADRLAALGLNLTRCGAQNVVVTMMQGQAFAKAKMKFDKILLDAPCSGTGTIRKSPKTINMWNPESIKRLCSLQKSLLTTAWAVLKPGKEMVYSTCSTEPEENEAIVSWALENLDGCSVESINLKVKSDPVLEFEGVKYGPEVKKCIRLWPQDNDTEGFFVARLKKQ